MVKMRHMFAFVVGVVSNCISSNVFAQETGNVAAVENIKDVAVGQIETARKLIDLLIEFVVKYSFQVVGGVIVIIIGWFIAKYTANVLNKLLEKKKVDVTVSKFIVGAAKLFIMTFAIIVAVGKFGIDIAPLIAGVSVAGFGLSFALQGPLSNYAAGATLIFTKPFKVGEIIEVAGEMGEVIDMKLPRTEIKTVDGNTIVIPNKHVIGEIIHNYSTNKKLNINIGVGYNTDVTKAIDIVKNVINGDDRIVKAANIGISEFADSSINIYARVWCKQDDYWNVMFDTNKSIFDAFVENNIEIPFPQTVVHLKKE